MESNLYKIYLSDYNFYICVLKNKYDDNKSGLIRITHNIYNIPNTNKYIAYTSNISNKEITRFIDKLILNYKDIKILINKYSKFEIIQELKIILKYNLNLLSNIDIQYVIDKYNGEFLECGFILYKDIRVEHITQKNKNDIIESYPTDEFKNIVYNNYKFVTDQDLNISTVHLNKKHPNANPDYSNAFCFPDKYKNLTKYNINAILNKVGTFNLTDFYIDPRKEKIY